MALAFARTGWPDRSVRTECTDLKDKCYRIDFLVLRIYFRIARTIFGVITFQDFAAPSLRNDTFALQSRRSDRPARENGKHS